MRTIVAFFTFLLLHFTSYAQGVGIGVASPDKKLSVNGSVVIDHAGNNEGALDSAALLFGHAPYNTGISSNKFPPGIGYNGLDFWTGGGKRISIAQNGNVGINVGTPLYKLHVNGDMAGNANSYVAGSLRLGPAPFNGPFRLHVSNGDSYFAGHGTFTGNLMAQGNFIAYGEVQSANIRATTGLRADEKFAVGGATDDNYRLRVYDGNARIGGEFHATGNSAIGGLPDAAFRLRVYDGNSRFGGDVEVTGALSIGGKGSVASQGPSPLRIGFASLAVDMHMILNADVGLYLDLPAFAASDDMRVSVSHIDSDPVSMAWSKMNITVIGMDAGNDRCQVRFVNNSGIAGSLRGVIYFMTVQRN
ncbi:MAG: hypothetical protein H7Y86_14175 [Rhizobacter sp.]|nr:hypothetical protein [Ferruginibacter sp.]